MPLRAFFAKTQKERGGNRKRGHSTLYQVSETGGGISVTNPGGGPSVLGGTYTVSLSAAIAKLGEPITQGGAGITFAAGTPGTAVVSINAENEVSFSISDARGRSLMSGIVSVEQASSLLSWSCNVPDTTETIDSKVYLCSLSVDALGNTTKSRSNGLGHTLQSVDQDGNVSTVQYDAGGNSIVSRDPNNVGQDCVYDQLGRRTSCTDTVGSVTASGYDKAGQQITATDAKNKVTHYAFDARGRRWKETDRLTYPTEWSFDAAGNLLSLKDAENQITSYGYNDAGQRTTEQYPDHVSGATIGQPGYGIITFGYDPLGRRITKQDQQGDVTSYNFDMTGRMLTRGYVGWTSSPSTSPLAGQQDTDTFTYDRAGRMLSGVKGRYNNTVTFSYDDRGQQIQETLTTHGQTYTVGYQKNVLGQTTQLQYPDGSLVDRAYTNRGQLHSVNYTPNAGALSSVATFTYDPGGRETQRNLGNGLTTTRGYFADNQIQSIATPTVETLTYTYDANKNPTSEARSGVMAPYSWTTGPTGWDFEDRLTNWSRTNGDSQTWNLSPVHDWNSTAINGAIQTRTHGPVHEILTMSGAGVSPTPATLQHDTKGNMTTDDRSCGMTWDFDNMMQSFVANGVSDLRDATYEYDAIGRRVAKNIAQTVGATTTTICAQAGDQVACEYSRSIDSTVCDRKYAYGSYIDEPINVINSAAISETRYWMCHNRQHSLYCVTGETGLLMEFYSYQSYGEIQCVFPNGSLQGVVPTADLTMTFTGRILDTESAMYQFRARTYSAKHGRFVSHDPLGYLDGYNTLSGYFAAENLDPFGTRQCSVVASEEYGPEERGGVNRQQFPTELCFKGYFSTHLSFGEIGSPDAECCRFRQYFNFLNIKIWLEVDGKVKVLRDLQERPRGGSVEDCNDAGGCYGDPPASDLQGNHHNINGWSYQMDDGPGQCFSLNNLFRSAVPSATSKIRLKARLSFQFTQIVSDECCTRDDVWRRQVSFDHEWDFRLRDIFDDAVKRGWRFK